MSGGGASPPVSLATDAELCALARRVPKPKMTGRLDEDNEKQMTHNAMVWVVDTLTKQPNFVMHVHGLLVALIKKQAKSKGDEFFDEISTLGKLDAEWLVIFLLGKSKFTIEELAQVKNTDPEGLRRLLSFAVQLPTSTKLPTAMRHKSICKMVLDARMKLCGDRLALWDKSYFHSSGVINWGKGCFTVTFEQGRASKVRHCSGKTADVPDYATITTAYELSDNHDDTLACVNLAGSSHKLHCFFKDSDSPHVMKSSRGKGDCFATLVDNAKAELEKLRAATTTSTEADVTGILQNTGSERKRAAAKRARDALEKRQENLKKQRRVVFNC